MKELTKKEKIYVLNEMIRYYSNVKGKCECMCWIMIKILKKDLNIYIYYSSYNDIFPEFYKYALIYKEKNFNPQFLFWLPRGEAKPRLKYCEKLLKVVKDNN